MGSCIEICIGICVGICIGISIGIFMGICMWMGVKNAYPSSESVTKMRTLRQKVDVELKSAPRGVLLEGVKNAHPFVRKCVKNAYP